MKESAREKALRLKLEASQARERRLRLKLLGYRAGVSEPPTGETDNIKGLAGRVFDEEGLRRIRTTPGPFIDKDGREWWIRDGVFHFDRDGSAKPRASTEAPPQNDPRTSGYVHCPDLDDGLKPTWYWTYTRVPGATTLQEPEKAQPATHLALDVAGLLEALAGVVRHRG